MKISEKVITDIAEIQAGKATHDEHRLTVLREVESALKNKAMDKPAGLTAAEEEQVLTSLIKLREASTQSPTSGSSPQPEEKELQEIEIIDSYLPRASSERYLRKLVHGAIAHLQADADGVKPGPRDMTTALQVAQQWIRAAGLSADGRMVSQIVEEELNK